MAAELRSGDICVHGSEDYADHREQLLPWSECLSLIDQYCQNLGLVSTAVGFVEKLKSMLADTAQKVADGTKYELYEENLLSEYHIRYGGYGGIAYHHVADSYVALFSHFISCGTWEAVYIIEGLLKNKSDIQPDTIHADTQGQSTPVFAVFLFAGY